MPSQEARARRRAVNWLLNSPTDDWQAEEMKTREEARSLVRLSNGRDTGDQGQFIIILGVYLKTDKSIATPHPYNVEITSLDNDVIYLIFKLLYDIDDTVSATCLGLTSTQFYGILKVFSPRPIPIYRTPWDLIPLHELLQDFMGPKYMYSGDCWHRGVFLNVENFGIQCIHTTDYSTCHNAAIQRLDQRYRDWFASGIWKGDSSWVVLPDPYQMGEKWYDQCYQIITSLQSQGSSSIWTAEQLKEWKEYKKYLLVYKEWQNRKLWGAWGNGLEEFWQMVEI